MPTSPAPSTCLRCLFARFVLGGVLLLCGLTLLVWLDANMEDSLEREWLALGALGLAIIGGALAALGYFGLLWHRLRGTRDNR
ncbi:MAG: hypothetical protein LPK85_03595 [Gammaproteobacteria bacterium]|nr:hypothetical protein [Gammaproteobacteria bacterium]